MKREILQKVRDQLRNGPRSIADIANALKIGWKTCEQYLMALKDLGLAYEIRMRKERIFYLKQLPAGSRVTIMSEFKAPDDIIVLRERGPKPEEILELT